MQEALLLAPVSGLYVPAGHGVKAMLALAAPMLAQKPPTGHSEQPEAPICALYEPAGHCAHSTAPGVAEYEPTVHG